MTDKTERTEPMPLQPIDDPKRFTKTALVQRINTPCPACRSTGLFIGSDGKLCCSWIQCPNPVAINQAGGTIERLTAERDAAREESAALLRKWDSDLESDSIIASCNCLTKTPGYVQHKPGCKYRLIMERNALHCQRDTLRAELSAAREENAVLKSQVENADVNLAQVRLSNSAMWRGRLNEMESKLSAANEAREKAEAAAKSWYGAGLSIAAALAMSGTTQNGIVEGVRELIKERDSLSAALEKLQAEKEKGFHFTIRTESEMVRDAEAALEKERAEVERLKLLQGSTYKETLAVRSERDDLRGRLAEAETACARERGFHDQARNRANQNARQLAEWQAVAGKKDAALKSDAVVWSVSNRLGMSEAASKPYMPE